MVTLDRTQKTQIKTNTMPAHGDPHNPAPCGRFMIAGTHGQGMVGYDRKSA